MKGGPAGRGGESETVLALFGDGELLAILVELIPVSRRLVGIEAGLFVQILAVVQCHYALKPGD